jgi:hypothetical protein
MIYEYDEKVFHIHMSSILHGVLVGVSTIVSGLSMQLEPTRFVRT